MPTDEEFTALKNQVVSMQDLLNRVALSHKKLLEQLFPQLANNFATFVERNGETTEALGNRLSEVMEGVGKLAQAVENIQTEMEIRFS